MLGEHTRAGERMQLSVEFLEFVIREMEGIAERWDAYKADPRLTGIRLSAPAPPRPAPAPPFSTSCDLPTVPGDGSAENRGQVARGRGAVGSLNASRRATASE